MYIYQKVTETSRERAKLSTVFRCLAQGRHPQDLDCSLARCVPLGAEEATNTQLACRTNKQPAELYEVCYV